MKLTPEMKKTLDEMWSVFGDDMMKMMFDFSSIKESYEAPEDIAGFLNIVEQYVDMKKQ